MHKHTVFIVTLICSLQSTCHAAAHQPELEFDRGYVCHDARKNLPEKRILNSPVIRAVDNFINSTLFNKILILRQQLSNMLFGSLSKDGHGRIGMYTYNGVAYSIQQLAHLELEGLAQENIVDLLLQAIKDFEHQTVEFLDLAKSYKSQMLILIDESLRLHKRKDSILLHWAEAKEGQEMLSFESRVVSFDSFAHFLHDLLNYLDDLIASCPKAQKIFLQTKTDKEQTIYAQRFKGIYERQKHKIDALK